MKKGIIEDYSKADLTSEEIIEYRKYYSKLKHQSEKNARLSKCVVCGNETTSFCDSHTIPRFVLDKIARNGKVVIGRASINYPFTDKEQGINKALTFRCICEKCDNERFQLYENPDSLNDTVNENMLRQIAIKNLLQSYSRQVVEAEQYKAISGTDSPRYWVTNIDACYSLFAIKKALKQQTYYLIDDIKLDYTVPIAFQGEMCLLTGFDGETINDYVNKPSDYDPHILHIAVFPLEESTKILIFINDGDKKYRQFYKTYRKLSLSEKLYAINYIILLYKDDWVLSPVFAHFLNEESTDRLTRTTQVIEGAWHVRTNEVVEYFNIQTCGSVHNFLIDRLDKK